MHVQNFRRKPCKNSIALRRRCLPVWKRRKQQKKCGRILEYGEDLGFIVFLYGFADFMGFYHNFYGDRMGFIASRNDNGGFKHLSWRYNGDITSDDWVAVNNQQLPEAGIYQFAWIILPMCLPDLPITPGDFPWIMAMLISQRVF